MTDEDNSRVVMIVKIRFIAKLRLIYLLCFMIILRTKYAITATTIGTIEK